MYLDVKNFLTKMQRETPDGDHSRKWLKLRIFFETKRWQMLGDHLLYMSREILWNDERALLAIYKECVFHLRNMLDPYVLVDIVEVVVRTMRVENKPLELLLKLSETVQLDADAFQYVRIVQAHLLYQKYNQNEAARLVIEELRAEIVSEQSKGKQPKNFVKFHVLAATFYFRIGEWALSFCSRMQYLETDLDSYPKIFWAEQAYLMIVNALLVEDKYEFDDVKKHDIVESLRSSEWEWILEVLNAFSMGNLEQFKKLRFLWMMSPELKENAAALYERIYVLTVLAVATKRLNLPCYIHFVDFAMELGMAAADVVRVVRRAIDTGFMEAKINLLDEVVEIDFLGSICAKLEVADDEN